MKVWAQFDPDSGFSLHLEKPALAAQVPHLFQEIEVSRQLYDEYEAAVNAWRGSSRYSILRETRSALNSPG